jgi:hypothetical protein
MTPATSPQRSALPLIVGFLACTALVTLVLVGWTFFEQRTFAHRLDAFQAQRDRISNETAQTNEEWMRAAKIAHTQLELEQKASESRDSIDKKLEDLKGELNTRIVDVSRTGLMYQLEQSKRQKQLLADLEALSNTLKASGINWYHDALK